MTKVREQAEVRNKSCNHAETCSKLWDTVMSRTSFVDGIENFTILIDHSAQVLELGFNEQARYVDGLLQVNGTGTSAQKLCSQPGAVDSAYNGRNTSKAPCYIEPSHPPNSKLDFFRLETLLAAAGAELDEESFPGSGQSVRYEGLPMTINIKYFNAVPWRGLVSTRYIYEVQATTATSYGEHDIVWTRYPVNRTLLAKHGIMLQANIAGRVGVFSFNGLLLQLTASLALLTSAALAVNLIARYVMRYRQFYSAALIDTTADFSHVDLLEARSLESLQETCRTRALACGGGRVDVINRLLQDGYDPLEDAGESARDFTHDVAAVTRRASDLLAGLRPGPR